MKKNYTELYWNFKKQVEKYCSNCIYWNDTCTKKIAIRECKKDRVKEINNEKRERV